MTSQLTDVEQKIFQELNKIDSKIADIYFGAISVLDRDSKKETVEEEKSLETETTIQKTNPDKIFQSAHSMREMLNILLRRIEIPEQEASFREKIRKFSDSQDALPAHMHGLFDSLFRLHNWFVNVSHHRFNPSETEFNENLEKHNSLLLRILTPHFESIKEIDDLLGLDEPKEKDMKTLMPLISKNYESYSYFFRKADSKWLTLLKNGPFFKNPPQTKIEGDFIQTPSWPESYYLSRIANDNPAEVYNAIENCPIPTNNDERNPRVLEDFIQSGLNMPCEYTAKIAALIVKGKWDDTRSMSLLEHKISELMEKLTEECNDVQTASSLANLVLDVTDNESPNPGGLKQ